MPSTAETNATLDMIQKEIMDVMERERELKRMNELKYNNMLNNNINVQDDDAVSSVSSRSDSTMSSEGISSSVIRKNNEINSFHNNNNIVQDEVKPQPHYTKNSSTMNRISSGSYNSLYHPAPLTRAMSVSVLNQGEAFKPTGRSYVPNTGGSFMNRFIKSRGKIQSTAVFSSNPKPINFQPEEVYRPPKITPEVAKRGRNGWIPIEEKLRREIQAAQDREVELREIRKSQGNLNLIGGGGGSSAGEESDSDEHIYPLRVTKSVNHLYDSCETIDDFPPSSLKPARSLAQLCDVSEDDYEPTQNIIQKFEKIIQSSKA